MPVTLVDIARIAKVSESAVSRALQDHPRISLATRERIKKIAAELDFEYNAHARSLSTQKSATVGVILANFGSRVNHTYYLDLLVNDLRAQLSANNFDMLLCDSQYQSVGDTNLSRLVRQRKVDGLIIIVADLPEKDRKAVERRHIPMILVNSPALTMSGQVVEGLPNFFTDNILGGRLAARHLVERGSRKLLCLADQGGKIEMQDRTAGFVSGLAEHGLVPQILSCTSYFTVVCDYLRAHLKEVAECDGIFCHTDLMACATLRVLQEAGIKVPEQVKVVGYDDIEVGTYFSPRLTTIHQPREAIAEQAVKDLVHRMGRKEVLPASSVSIAPWLVVREST